MYCERIQYMEKLNIQYHEKQEKDSELIQLLNQRLEQFE